MAAPADQDQKWLIDCLSATLDTSRDVRTFAETSLQQASLQPGFGAGLAGVTVNKEISFGLRQLAAVLLKQFIKQHWQEDEESFVHPVVSVEEKGVIRRLLLPSLHDPHGKIRTAIGMAVASIAYYDWPEDWPELLPFLLNLISDQSNIDGVRGALRCLALISDDLDDSMVPKLVPALFPHLHTIITSPHMYEKSLRVKALSIVHSCFSVLGSMSGVYKSETTLLMTPMINSLMEQFSNILQPPVQSADPVDWSIRMEVLKCLLQLVESFPGFTEAQFSVVVAPLWQTFVSTLKVYQLSLIQGSEDAHSGIYDSDGGEKSLETFVIQLSSIQGSEDSHSGRYNSDGGEKSLEFFVIQLFEFLVTTVANSRLSKVIGTSIKELVYYTLGFLQMTQEQVHTWSHDANQYVADEDDVTYSCRVSGSLLLEEILNSYNEEGIESIIEAAQKHFFESCQARIAGSPDWWRFHEASLFALGSLSDQLLEAQSAGEIQFDFGNLLNQMVTENMGAGVHEYPFLHARAFSTVSKFSSLISQSIREQFLYSAIQAVATDVPPPVKVGACRSLPQLLPNCDQTVIQPHIMGLLSSLTDLLKQASDETLHLVLETLKAAIEAGHDQSVTIEPIISPIILNVWAQHVSDPFISIDAVEVLEAIKNAPGCMLPLVSRILPSVGPILEKPQMQPDGLVAGSLDLLTMLLKNSPLEVVKSIFDLCFNPVVQIILESDDHGELQNATECLTAFISCGRQELLAWGTDSGFVMKRLLDAASRLLDPDLESYGSLFVGSYVLQLILHLPAQMAVHIRELIAAVVKRMQSCELAGVKSSLIVILARLVHLSAPGVDQLINLLLTLPIEAHGNAFSYVMSEWTKLQGEIQGSYQIKVTTTALALLLSSRHPELAKVNVQGYLTKTSAGITTRSKAKLAPDQWTVLPLPAKIVAILSDTLVEIQEQVLDENDEDSDWEEVSQGNSDIPQEVIYSTKVPSNARPSVEHLDALAKVFNESEDDDDGADLMKSDPLNEIKLAEFLRNFFVDLSNSDKQLFDYLCQGLTSVQRRAVEKIISG